ncbi:MAG: HDOD domain-containing protein [Peptococcaceae bacterium]|jgi:EAL and modified HD-GYP domain-containing signal transduction protein|nr:HDOD domain-containing protein [Peptococcaceae bacterium]
MDIFIARQPIFDTRQNVYGYELLYRQGTHSNAFNSAVDADEASSKVMVDSFLDIGINKITDGKKAFVNFTKNLIMNESATLFSKDTLVVEVLETIQPTPEIVEKCKKLKDQGYLIALDDFVFSKEFIPLIGIADIIKIDFLITPEAELEKYFKIIGKTRIKFLAEKVETREVYNLALSMGFAYFQGYFFSKPVILSEKSISPMKMNYIRILKLLNSPELDFNALGAIISQDLALSYKLLKLVNSAAFGTRNRIGQVNLALSYLGEREIRKWISLIVMMGISAENPQEVLLLSLVRAKFSELLAPPFQMGIQKEALFIMGLFSLMDTLVNQPIDVILKDIPLEDSIEKALVEDRGPFAPVLNFVRAYEQGDWESVRSLSQTHHLSDELIQASYLDSLEWAKELNML